MSRPKQEPDIELSSVQDLLRLIKQGDHLLITVPNLAFITELLVPSIGHAISGQKAAFVGTALPAGIGSFPFISLSASRSSGSAIALVKAGLGRLPRKAPVIITNLFEDLPWCRKPGQQVDLVSRLSGHLIRQGRRSVWLMSVSERSRDAVSFLQRSASYHLRLFQIGNTRCAQFIKAAGILEEDFFLPRILELSPRVFKLHGVTVPAPPSGTGPDSVAVQRDRGDLIEQKYRNIVESLSDGIIVFDLRATYRDANARACEILGYSREELQRITLKEILAPESYRGALRALVGLRRKGKTSLDLKVRKKNGRPIHINAAVAPLRDRLFVCSLRDITDRVKADEQIHEAEAYFRSLVDESPLPTALFVHRKTVMSNAAFRRAFPWCGTQSPVTLSELLGGHNPGLVKELAALVDIPGTDVVAKREADIAGPEGSVSRYELSVRVLRTDERTGLLVTFVDVSERRRELHALQESEHTYRALVENSIDAISMASEEKFAYVSRGFLAIFGYDSPDELIGRDISIVVAPKDRNAVLARSKQRREGKEVPNRYEYTGVRKDGTQLTIEVQVAAMKSGKDTLAIAHHRDITERKAAEEDLRRRTKSLEVLGETLEIINQKIELDELFAVGLQAAMRVTEMEIGGMYAISPDGGTLKLATHHGFSQKLLTTLGEQSTGEGVTGYVVKTMEPLLLQIGEYPAHLPYRSLFESEGIQAAACVPLCIKGSVNAVMLLATRKPRVFEKDERILLTSLGSHMGIALENAALYSRIKSSEERYRAAVENVSDVIYHSTASGQLLFISPNVQRFLGYTAAEFQRSPDFWRGLLHPDDRSLYSRRITNQAGQIDEFTVEYRMLPKGKAAYRWFRDSIRYKRNQSGVVESITGMLSDVTERVALEEQLTQSQQLKTNVFDSIQEGVVVFDTALSYLDWNRAMAEISGVSRESIVGLPFEQGIPALRGEAIRASLEKALNGETMGIEDVTLMSREPEEELHLWVRISPLRDHEGTIKGAVAILTDVTSRRRLEHELKESEETLRNVIDAMGDALVISDLQGKVWEVNREFAQITGYARSDVLGTDFPYPWLVDEEMAKFVTWIAELRKKNTLRDFDMTWRKRDGQHIAISLNTTLLRNALGEPVAMLNIARDISERKRLTTELERKNRQIEMLNRIISKATTTLNFDEIFESIAGEVMNFVRYDQLNVALLSENKNSMLVHACNSPTGMIVERGRSIPVEHTVSKLSIAAGHAVIVGDLTEEGSLGPETVSIAEGLRSQISIPIYLNENILGTLNLASAVPHAFTGDELTFLQPIADQVGAIINRIHLFQQVSDDSKYIHNLLNSINSVVYTVDNQNRVTEVNKAWREFAQYQGLDHLADEHAVLGRDLDEVLPSPELKEACARVVPELFARSLEYFGEEFELQRNGGRRTFHLSINPMVINGKVTALVFMNTDITRIKQTEEEVRTRNKQLVALNTISALINKTLALDEVLSAASQQLHEIVGADVILFYMHDERGGRLQLKSHLGVPESLVSSIRTLDPEASATGLAIETGAPLVISSGLLDDGRVAKSGREIFSNLGINTLVAVPLKAKDRTLGALDVAFSTEQVFDVGQLQFLVLIANQLAPAIENAQLYAEIKSQVLRMTSLYELGKELTGTLDLHTLMHVVSASVSKAMGAERFVYYRVDAEQKRLKLVFEKTNENEVFGKAEHELPVMYSESRSAMDQVLMTGEPYLGIPPEPLGGQSGMIVPVRSKGAVAGIMAVTSNHVDAFASTHLRLLESIANLTEIAVEKTSLYEDTVNKSLEIESRNRELDDFTYVVSHDLKEPLISIEGYSRILLKDYNEQIDSEGKGYLSSLIASSARMKSLIDDLLMLSRLGRESDVLEEVAVNEVLRVILDELQFSMRERNVSVSIPPSLPVVRYNSTQLSMVFRNLLSNAFKFNDKPEPKIEITFRDDGEHYVFSVADNGIGIEQVYFDRIFMIFQRLQRSEQYRGTGAGLTIVKKIVERHRGKIWLESEPGQGTTFHFTIPKAGS